ncbi:inactive ubiquitin carboxyl-terminal hydrolase [Thraustotheca clavata]|uniref:Inactive ubiquitin carboxyl-terminal hydrolase n=1 Tax=Thraustotheca clavata TaxID=74557 RepID=A0A1V9ZN09_9STRA|nr:inactive ubiquitin carboxyl-terminal hydrolase [Thraustotheca clavata]
MDRATLLKHASLHKGLTNYFGQNNCFLNVVIQSLWHLDSFRVLIRTLDHSTLHNINQSCVLCELKEIFTYYEFSDESSLAPDNVRIALDLLYKERFQLGRMADATETLDTILAFMHTDQLRHTSQNPQAIASVNLATSIQIKDIDCMPKCIAHAIFEANMFDVYHCMKCRASSDPDMWKDTLYRVYFAELYKYVGPPSFFSSMTKNSPAISESNKFANVLKALLNDGPGRSCPDHDTTGCPGHCFVERWLMKFPIVFAISIVWPSTSIGGAELRAFAQVIPHRLDLSHVFQLGSDLPREEAMYLFRGMVCYYGKHYVSFFQSQSSDEQWYLFDDVNVRTIGTWDEVRKRIEKGCYQPTILFWEKENLKYEQLEELAEQVHQRSSRASSIQSPINSPRNAQLDVQQSNSLPSSPSRAAFPCSVFTTKLEKVIEMENHSPALDAIDTLNSIDMEPVQAPKTPLVSPKASILTSPKERHFIVLQGAEAHSKSGFTAIRIQLTATDGGLGLLVAKRDSGILVSGLESNAAGEALPAKACGAIQLGDKLVQINDEDIASSTVYQIMERLITTAEPVTLKFERKVPWLCLQCTLINDHENSKCAACEYPHKK